MNESAEIELYAEVSCLLMLRAEDHAPATQRTRWFQARRIDELENKVRHQTRPRSIMAAAKKEWSTI